MKSILGISIALHVAAFSTALAIASQRGLIHVATAQHTVMEIRLGAAPPLPHAMKNAAPVARKTVSPAPAPPPEIAPPVNEPRIAAATSAALAEPAAASTTGCDCAPTQSALAFAASSSTVAGSSGSGGAIKAEGSAQADSLPWTISSPAPAYPREARHKGWSGRVGVHVLISEQGTVQQVELVSSSGHAELDEAALAALRKWIFHPAQKDGRAAAAWVVVPVLFRLDD
jgi:protein TonB